MKKLNINLLLILLIIMVFTSSVVAEINPIKVIVKGKTLYDFNPIVENDRTLVPVRLISEELDFNVNYVEKTKKVIIEKEDINIEITIGYDIARVNNMDVQLDVKPFIKDGITFAPLRFISECLGEEVIWDGENRIVLVGEFKDETRIDNTFLYFNKENSYTLSLPNSWREEATIETKGGNLYVYDKKSTERFIEDGYEGSGPVFEIRSSDYPVTANVPYDENLVLNYKDGKYIEVIFDNDFQYYPETLDSYRKIREEAKKVIGTFMKVDKDSIVKDDRDNHKKEIEILNDILGKYVPDDIFNKDEVLTYKNPVSDTSFLYMRLMENEEIIIKIESIFDNNGNLLQYHLKSYGYDLEENQLTQDEALKLANKFANEYVDKNIEVIKIPDLYPSLYEENKNETFGDTDRNHVIVVDLEHGFIEFYGLITEIPIERKWRIDDLNKEILSDKPQNTEIRYYITNDDGTQYTVLHIYSMTEEHDIDGDGFKEIIVYHQGDKRGIGIYYISSGRLKYLDVNKELGSIGSEYMGNIGNLKSEYRSCIEVIFEDSNGVISYEVYKFDGNSLIYVSPLEDALRK